MTSVSIETLGCKLNQAESEKIWHSLIAAGYRLAAPGETADVMILNTCTVTHIADRKARQAVRSAVRINPDIAVIVTGCYAERDRKSLLALTNVIAVLPNSAKDDIVPELARLGFRGGSILNSPAFPRNRSFIRVQDGCDHNCAYCIVPLVRPRKTCVAPEHIIEEIRLRCAAGYREVVLTGTEIGEYLSEGVDLAGLIWQVLEKTQIERIRISSLQPQEITPGLVNLWNNPRLCRHFHLSLQSGSDSVLKRMKRRYSTESYRRAVALIRSSIPQVAITTDIIAGFPGETDTEFEQSCSFIQSLEFARLHVFPFSKRPGTAAALLTGSVEPAVVKKRVDRLLKLGRQSEIKFREGFRGSKFQVLFEFGEDGEWVGYTDNYIRVKTESFLPLDNQILDLVL